MTFACSTSRSRCRIQLAALGLQRLQSSGEFRHLVVRVEDRGRQALDLAGEPSEALVEAVGLGGLVLRRLGPLDLIVPHRLHHCLRIIDMRLHILGNAFLKRSHSVRAAVPALAALVGT